MKLGYIGLGKMGLNMVERMLEFEHEVVATNRSEPAIKEAEKLGETGAYSHKELIEKLDGGPFDEAQGKQKIVWLMVPWKAVDSVLEEVIPLLNEGDLIIDGGNSPYLETIRRAKEITAKGIHFMDIGTSGGPGGARTGACMMVGGEKEDFDLVSGLLKDLCVPEGFGYMGKHGAGHYVKMVHNGIEYGMMQAIGEGFGLMKQASEFDIDLGAVVNVYNHGSVIESRLIGWLGTGYDKYGVDLEDISGEVSASGEGLWTVEAAKREGIDVPIIEGSLKFRDDSQGNSSYIGQVVSVQRNQFGGHDVSKDK